METPSKFLVLMMLSLLLSIDAAAHGTCTACNQLVFKENKGQWNNNVLYKTEMHYAYTYFEDASIMYQLLDTADLKHYRSEHPFQVEYKVNEDRTLHGHAVRSTFVGANPNVVHTGTDKLEEYFNYYIGNDKSKWASHVAVSYTHLTLPTKRIV